MTTTTHTNEAADTLHTAAAALRGLEVPPLWLAAISDLTELLTAIGHDMAWQEAHEVTHQGWPGGADRTVIARFGGTTPGWCEALQLARTLIETTACAQVMPS